jgi:hypothetical protein
MDQCKLAILAMALTDTDWGPRDADGRRRALTVEELDALADFPWHWPDLKGAMAACAHAVRRPWRPRASHRGAAMRRPSAEATAHG